MMDNDEQRDAAEEAYNASTPAREEGAVVVATTTPEAAYLLQQRLEARNRELLAVKQTLAQERAGFDQFKGKVRAKAIEVANRQDWCLEGLNDALTELGLEPYDPRKQVVLRMEVTLSARCIASTAPDLNFVNLSLNSDDIGNALSRTRILDSDWDDVEVEDVRVECEAVEEYGDRA